MAATIQEVAVTCNAAALAAIEGLRPSLAGLGWDYAGATETGARFTCAPRVAGNRTGALELALRLSRAGVPVEAVALRG